MKKKLIVLASTVLFLAGCGPKPVNPSDPEDPCTHVDSDHNGLCDLCGENVEVHHIDNDNNHKCDVCEFVMSSCEDLNNNHNCDVCGNKISEHKDENKDHSCDICGEKMSEHKDDDHNHDCDICGEKMSDHVDADKNHYCEYCEQKISDCVDNDKNNRCDYCGKILDITKEPVDKETFVKAFEQLKGNFSANVYDEIYYDQESLDFNGVSNAYIELNPMVKFEEIKNCSIKLSFDAEKHHDEIVDYYGREPEESEIRNYALSKLSPYFDIHAIGTYSAFTEKDVKTDASGKVFYIEEINSKPGTFASLAPSSEFYSTDFNRHYEVNNDNVIRTDIYQVKDKYYFEMDDNDMLKNFDYLDMFKNFGKYFDLGLYDPKEKTFTFDNEDFKKIFDFNIFYSSMIGAILGSIYGDSIDVGSFVVDFTEENILKSITLDLSQNDSLVVGKNKIIIEFLEFDTEDIIVPEIPKKECNHDKYSCFEDSNSGGHFCYCPDCLEIIYTKPHDYDENGVCKLCGDYELAYKTLDGEPLPHESYTEFSIEYREVTGEVESICIPYDLYDKFLPEEVADFTGFDIKGAKIWAPLEHQSLESFLILDYASETKTEDCIYSVDTYYQLYKIENGVVSKYLDPFLVHYEEEDHEGNLKIDMTSLVKIKDGIFECDAYCEECGNTYHGVAEADFYMHTSGAEDMSTVSLWFTYSNNDKQTCHLSVSELTPIYDENSIDYYTGARRPIEPLMYGDQLLGYLHTYGNNSTNLFFESAFGEERLMEMDGFTYYKCLGTDGFELVIGEKEYDTKDPDTCVAYHHFDQVILINGEEFARYENKYNYEDQRYFNHDFEALVETYHYDEAINMYTMDIVCKDCGQTFTLVRVNVEKNYDGTHTFNGVYYVFFEEENTAYPFYVSITVDCVEDVDNPHQCIYCGGNLW